MVCNLTLVKLCESHNESIMIALSVRPCKLWDYLAAKGPGQLAKKLTKRKKNIDLLISRECSLEVLEQGVPPPGLHLGKYHTHSVKPW